MIGMAVSRSQIMLALGGAASQTRRSEFHPDG